MPNFPPPISLTSSGSPPALSIASSATSSFLPVTLGIVLPLAEDLLGVVDLLAEHPATESTRVEARSQVVTRMQVLQDRLMGTITRRLSIVSSSD